MENAWTDSIISVEWDKEIEKQIDIEKEIGKKI